MSIATATVRVVVVVVVAYRAIGAHRRRKGPVDDAPTNKGWDDLCAKRLPVSAFSVTYFVVALDQLRAC